jgi:hypothetical protein
MSSCNLEKKIDRIELYSCKQRKNHFRVYGFHEARSLSVAATNGAAWRTITEAPMPGFALVIFA